MAALLSLLCRFAGKAYLAAQRVHAKAVLRAGKNHVPCAIRQAKRLKMLHCLLFLCRLW